MGIASKILVFVFLVMLVICCDNISPQSVTSSKRVKKDISYLQLKDSIFCRQFEINNIVNDRILNDCLDLALYGEPCFEEIKKQSFARLIIAPMYGDKVEILSIEKSAASCWLKTIKTIPRNSFGTFAYLVQGKSLEYETYKSISSEDEYKAIVSLSSSFQKIDTGEEADYLLILELTDSRTGKQKMYSNSNQLSEEEMSKILEM